MGNIYLVESCDYKIKKIYTDGNIITLAGIAGTGYVDGHPLSSKFSFSNSIALDKRGNLLVTDTNNHCIRVITNVAEKINTLINDMQRIPGLTKHLSLKTTISCCDILLSIDLIILRCPALLFLLENVL